MIPALHTSVANDAWIVRLPTWESGAIRTGAGFPDLTVASDDDVRVAFSGVLFEPDELAERLSLPKDLVPGPAALVLRAYRKLGDGWLNALRGHFAVVVDDRSQDRVVAARDPMGQHPLFFASGSHGLLFSWSTDALLAEPGVSKELNRVVMAEHLVNRWPDASETYFLAISRVPPGHILEVDRSGPRLRRYWDPALHQSDGQGEWGHEQAVERFGEALDRAVGRGISQGQAGIYLSGGLDSISVAATAVDAARRMGQAAPIALSLGFPDPACNEEFVQRGVAQALGVRQEFVPFDTAVGQGGLLKAATEMAADWPAPMMNVWNPAYSYLAQRGRERGCRVILTGSGGDEWLAVGPYLSADLMRQGRVLELVRFVGMLQRSYRISRPQAVYAMLWNFGLRPVLGMLINRRAPRYWQARRQRRSVAGTPAWVAPDPVLRRQMDARAGRVLAPSEPVGSGFYEQDMRTAIEHPLMTMEAEEHFEMGRRLGVRFAHPYWDADLVDLLYRMPPRLLATGGRTKGLVREAMARRFPHLGFDRQRKVHATGFYRRIMRSEGPAVWTSLGGLGTLNGLGLIDTKRYVGVAVGQVGGQEPVEGYRIWTALQLEAWAQSRA